MARRCRQRGAVLVTIMVVTAVTMLIASTLVNHLAVQEADAIERHLGEVRAHWAMVGHVNHVLRRAWAAHPTLCPGPGTCANDAVRVTAFGALARQLQTQGGTTRRWVYAEYGGTPTPSYYFDVAMAVSDIPPNADGRLRFELEITEVGTFEALKGLKPANPSPVARHRLWVEICLKDGTTVCPGTLPIPALTGDEGHGQSLITRVTRVPPS